MSSKRIPLWQHLVAVGHATSRDDAEKLIRAGLVKGQGAVIDKPGTLIRTDHGITLSSTKTFVSRGGFKLERAINEFGIDVNEKICVDVGSSTGGFTDLLLQRGARKVYAIDVGYGELDWKIRSDSRVVVMERTNARYVESIPDQVSLVVGDLSFISLQVLFPVIRSWIEDQSHVVMLVKPQFEARREEVPDGGVVTEPAVHRSVLLQTIAAAQSSGFLARGLITSPIRGGSGNKEFLLWLTSAPKNQQLDPDGILSLVNRALAEDIDAPTP